MNYFLPHRGLAVLNGVSAMQKSGTEKAFEHCLYYDR